MKPIQLRRGGRPQHGYYYTDKDGRITISNLEPGTTITARETKTLDGIPQSIKIKVGEVQTMTFWNKKAGGLIITKLDAVSKEPLAGVRFKLTYADGTNVDQDGGKVSTNGIYVTDSNGQINVQGVTFEIREMDGGLVDTITTGDNGRVFLSMDAGDYYAVEIEAAEGFKIDSTPHYFTIQDGKTTTLTVTNAPFSGIIIHKVDSVTGDGIYGVKFARFVP